VLKGTTAGRQIRASGAASGCVKEEVENLFRLPQFHGHRGVGGDAGVDQGRNQRGGWWLVSWGPLHRWLHGPPSPTGAGANAMHL